MLAMREHSRGELERKLRFHLLTSGAERIAGETGNDELDELDDRGAALLQATLHQVLDDLERQGLLSDRRAADALLQSKSPRFGSRRLKQMLQARAFDAQLMSEMLTRARESELERATEVWRRRFGQAPTSLKERARQQRFLTARGFESPVIDRVMKLAAETEQAACEPNPAAPTDPSPQR